MKIAELILKIIKYLTHCMAKDKWKNKLKIKLIFVRRKMKRAYI